MNSLFSLRSGSPHKEVLKLMEYDKNTWQSGDTITAAKLNNIENALAALTAAQAPLECTVTIGEDKTTGKTTATLNKTVADIWAAAQAGKQIKAVAADATVPGDLTATITIIVPIEIFEAELSDIGTVYVMKARVDMGPEDALFIAENLSADDTVVLTEV